MDEARERILVALDTPDTARAAAWVRQLGGRVGGFKLGLEFLHAAGPDGVRAVQAAGARRLFLDVKLADIPNTVAGAVRSLCRLHPWMLNIHATAGPAAMRAAREAAEESAAREGAPRPLLIAVTVLTSLSDRDLQAIGLSGGAEAAAVRLALLARECGLDGVVASPREAPSIRAACGRACLIVAPGVRPAGEAVHDQARVATPAEAARAGVDFIVVGRAITAAADPGAAADRIAGEWRAAGIE